MTTIAASAASVLVAPSTSAQSLCRFGPNPIGGSPFECENLIPSVFGTEGDKTVTLLGFDFGGTHTNGDLASGFIEFEDFELPPPGSFLGDEFIFDVVFENGLEQVGITNGSGFVEYLIEIEQSIAPDFTFNLVGLDSSEASPGVTVIKDIFLTQEDLENDENSIGQLISVDGNDVGSSFVNLSGLTSVYIRDSYEVGEAAVLLEFDNDFIQAEGVPEPASILGLLVVGGLGLGLKRKKQ